MPRNLVAVDPFTYEDGELATVSAGKWTPLNALNAGQPMISGNMVQGASSGHLGATRYDGPESISVNHVSSLVLVDVTFGSDSYGNGVIGRASPDTHTDRDYYFFIITTTKLCVFGMQTANAETIFHSAVVSAFVNGDRIELECEGTTIRACRNGVPLGGSFTVTNGTLTTGRPGIAPIGGEDVCKGNDWEAYDLTVDSGSVSVAHMD